MSFVERAWMECERMTGLKKEYEKKLEMEDFIKGFNRLSDKEKLKILDGILDSVSD
jgi:hypothetical protein